MQTASQTTASPDWLRHWTEHLGRRPKIGLALGSGATWGVAHIGVLSVFQELNIPIDLLSGCSAGGFVGALYAGGITGASLEKCGREYRWRDAGKLIVPPKMGMATNDRMSSYLQSKIGNPRFKDLRLPFYVVATNVQTGERMVFHEGSVIPAVMASSAIPGIFAPVLIDGAFYFDGSLVDRVPCEILRTLGADLVISADLRGNQQGAPGSIYEVFRRAMDIALRHQVESDRLNSDLMIRPRLEDINAFGFNQNDLLIERGREAAYAELTRWQPVFPKGKE